MIVKEEIDLTEESVATKILEFIRQADESAPIEDAQIIVSGGKGMASAANFDMLSRLAHILGGVVAGSRKTVEAGWLPVSSQVGQTGKTVRPKIYFAVGISGAIQHLVGMQGSDIIVAVNKDPNAPIFKLATYGIVGDLFDIIPKLTGKLKEALKTQ
ncbi:MAG: electron transfer flavoprotein subunit alpha/FixB family protein [Candidatus Margulisiibacteriota bacterium]